MAGRTGEQAAGTARLMVDGRDVAPLEVAEGFRARGRGLLGRNGIDGALLLDPAGSVHTFGMRFTIDVALCDPALRVLATRTLLRSRVTRPRRRARAVLEAEAGAFDRWCLRPGSQLSIKP